MGKVFDAAAASLNNSAAFLNENKGKSIQTSTLKAKFADWLKLAKEQRNTYAMGVDAFDQLQTHPEWIVKMVTIIKMQAVALVSSFVFVFNSRPWLVQY